MRMVPTCTSTFPCIFPAYCLQVQGRTQMVHCALLVPSVQNKRSTGGRYNNGKHLDTDGRRRYGPRIPCQVNHHLRGQATRVSNVLPSKRWRGWTRVGRVETRREPSGKHLAKGRECKRAHSGPLPLAKDNPSNQSSALEPATACLEGRVSQDRRPFAMNWLYWLVNTIQTVCERP